MELTLFLAKVFGLYLLVVGAGILFNKKGFEGAVNEIVASHGLAYISALVTLVIGILLILTHNVWVADWPVIITILAWVIFIKGALRVVYPKIDADLSKALRKETYYTAIALGSILVGAFLTYQAFFV